jgi:ribosome-binding protein aMBF1 (putative translation factor)
MQTRTSEQARFDKILGQVIKEQREALGMTRAEISAEIGRTKTIILKIENGELSSNIYRIVELCLIMEVNPSDILDRAMYIWHTQKPTP